MSGSVRTTHATATAQRRGPVARTTGAGKTLQPKLDVTPAGDRYEAEADRVAAQVMGPGTAPAMPQISSLVGTLGGQRVAKEGTAANAEKREDLKEKEGSGRTAQAKARPNAEDKKEPRAARKMPGSPADDESKPKSAQLKSKGPGEDEPKGKATSQRKARNEEPPKKTQRALKPATNDEDRASRKAQKKTKAEEPEKRVQRDAGGGGFTAPSATEGAVDSMQRQSGTPLVPDVRRFMESRIGGDFSDVQVHDSPAAHQASDNLGAHAFTVGRDIFFARDAYRPDTTAGRRLIAHELTHTIQQAGGSAQAKRAQRTGPAPGSGTGTAASATPPASPVWQPEVAGAPDPDRKIDVPKKEIVAPELRLPKVNGALKGADISTTTPAAAEPPSTKISLNDPFTRYRPTPRAGASQRERWVEGARNDSTITDGLTTSVRNWVTANPVANRTPMFPTGQENQAEREILYVRRRGSRGAAATSVGELLIGNAAELAQHANMLIPNWDRQGNERVGRDGFQVDHIQEVQHGGAHDWSNLALLHARPNGQAGPAAQGAWNAPLTTLLDQAAADHFWSPGPGGDRPRLDDLKTNWSLTFKQVLEGDRNYTGEAYLKEDIKNGEQLRGLMLMNDEERRQTGVSRAVAGVQPGEFSIFAYRSGGKRWRVANESGTWTLKYDASRFLGGFENNPTIDYDWNRGAGNQLGTFSGNPIGGRIINYPRPFVIPLLNDEALGSSVFLDPDRLRVAVHGSVFPGLSPLAWDDFGVGPDGLFFGSGRIQATPFLIRGIEVPMELHGDTVTISYPLPTDRLNFGPVSVDQASLSLGFDSRGVVLGGSADVSVSQLGRGHLEARVGGGGPRVEGDFHFDFDFLANPTARFLYDMNQDKLELTLQAGIPPGRIPGIASGNIDATFSKEGIEVAGTMRPAGFLSAATITVSYTREQGLKLEANDIPLPLGNLPAVRDARVSVGAARSPEGVWLFYGSGSAQFALPSITGGMQIAIRDDVITFRGTGTVARGPATGSLEFTATNQEVDEAGQPVLGQALDHFRTWGRGEVTVRFGNILTGTAGIELTDDNEIIIRGGLALPPVFEVFPVRRYERQLLHIEPPEFPIWGVSIAGVGIGIFAFVDAYLNFDAFVGPGQLKDTRLTVSYNFMNPQQASVDGNATFDVPAGAGFTLDVGGGLRARLATAQVSGRVGLDARLGIQANAGADVSVHWDPTDGLALNANAYARVSPRFEIGANASVTASVDLLVAEPSYTWGPWRRQLGSFGPAMSVGVEFPVSWSERNGLELSLDNIRITQPEIDAGQLMKDAFLELV